MRAKPLFGGRYEFFTKTIHFFRTKTPDWDYIKARFFTDPCTVKTGSLLNAKPNRTGWNLLEVCLGSGTHCTVPKSHDGTASGHGPPGTAKRHGSNHGRPPVQWRHRQNQFHGGPTSQRHNEPRWDHLFVRSSRSAKSLDADRKQLACRRDTGCRTQSRFGHRAPEIKRVWFNIDMPSWHHILGTKPQPVA